jgi:type II secretory pathway pseudopilin PulG
MTRQTLYQRRGFTILEVVLTLSMAVVLMSLVGAALQFYSNNMNARDMDIRRIQLAASVLQMIADDLRATIYTEEFDSSVLEGFLAGAAGQAIAGAVDPAISQTLGLDAIDGSMLEDPSGSETMLDLMSSTMTLRRPGIIGNQFEMQFDISRLPRLEQWQQTIDSSTPQLNDIPSDLKTVTYYVQPPGAVGGVSDPLQGFLPVTTENAASLPGGLVRRELDRAANKWAVQSGGIAGLLSTGDLVATEVVAIEFAYFDGTNWQMFWNSDDMQSLPVAIQVKITIGDPAGIAGDGEVGLAESTVGEARSFTQIIQIPAGRVRPLDMATGVIQ